nr:MAG TPA: hypothetical protein [Bacteriophage sp.]
MMLLLTSPFCISFIFLAIIHKQFKKSGGN